MHVIGNTNLYACSDKGKKRFEISLKDIVQLPHEFYNQESLQDFFKRMRFCYHFLSIFSYFINMLTRRGFSMIIINDISAML